MLFAIALNPIGILVTLLILCVIIWAARALLSAFSIGDPIATVVYVVLVLCLLFWLVNVLGGSVPTFHLS